MSDYERNADVSKTLTDKWKKCELNRNKVYYYETPFNTVDTASGYWLCNHLDTEKDKVKILGEVPSYKQWNMVYKTEFELLEQVVKLKELLKNHKLLFELEKDNTKDVLQRGKYAYLINEIDQVL